MVEYLRPVGILTGQAGSRSPPPGARPGSAQGYYDQQRSRDNSQESTGHVTRYDIFQKKFNSHRFWFIFGIKLQILNQNYIKTIK